MIRTPVRIYTTGETVDMKIPDAVFSAMRGPDRDNDTAKGLGAAILRAYLKEYEYGSQISPTTLAWHIVDGRSDYYNINKNVKELSETIHHYAWHQLSAFEEFTKVLRQHGFYKEANVTEEFAMLWDIITNTIETGMSAQEKEKRLEAIKEQLINVFFLIVWRLL